MKTKQQALYALVDYTVRVIAVDALKNAQLDNQADILKNLPKIIDQTTANAAYYAAAYVADAVNATTNIDIYAATYVADIVTTDAASAAYYATHATASATYYATHATASATYYATHYADATYVVTHAACATYYTANATGAKYAYSKYIRVLLKIAST